jgi:hypothetical protein
MSRTDNHRVRTRTRRDPNGDDLVPQSTPNGTSGVGRLRLRSLKYRVPTTIGLVIVVGTSITLAACQKSTARDYRTLMAATVSSQPSTIIGAKPAAVTDLVPWATTTLSTAGSHTGSPTGALSIDAEGDNSLLHSFSNGDDQVHSPAADAPTPAPTLIASARAVDGFDGVTQLDQQRADGGHQPEAFPPDQALCAGNGYLLEGVNDALRVYTRPGTALTDTIAFGPFLGDGHEIVSTAPLVLGPLHSDSRCLFDADTGRFFLSVMRYELDPQSFEFVGRPAVELAVSRGADPRGVWDVYRLDATGDLTDPAGAVAGCPCYGDFPSLGADGNGVFIGYNLYPQAGGLHVGYRLVAVSKRRLADRGAPNAVTFAFGPDPVDLTDGHFSMSAAITPPGGTADPSNGGTEWVLSSHGHVGTTINVMAVTNTSSLATDRPDLRLASRVLYPEPFFSWNPLPSADQRDGPRPLAAMIQQQNGGAMPPVEFLDSTGSRMRTVEYADGRLWAATNTLVQPPHGPVRVGVAWFQIAPSVDSAGAVSATIANQGYLTIDRQNLLNPAIAVSSHGQGALVFSLVGPDYYPSAAYVPIDENGTGQAQIFGIGTAPLDEEDGYQALGASSRSARYGDYSAAATDSDGTVWLATQYVGNLPRSQMSNWDTRIAHVEPS